MIDFDQVQHVLPTYLSPDAQESLFMEMKAFTEEPHDRLYSGTFLDDPEISQGDGLDLMPVTNLPSKDIKDGPVIVLSNSCDIDKSNNRSMPPRISYCPIVTLSRLENLLKSKDVSDEAIRQMLEDIRRQRITSIFYLPKSQWVSEECVAFLDRPNNCDLLAAPPVDKGSRSRLFSLSQFGWYLYIFKLSLHFTRMQEGMERG